MTKLHGFVFFASQWPPDNYGCISTLGLHSGHWVQLLLIPPTQAGMLTVSLCSLGLQEVQVATSPATHSELWVASVAPIFRCFNVQIYLSAMFVC